MKKIAMLVASTVIVVGACSKSGEPNGARHDSAAPQSASQPVSTEEVFTPVAGVSFTATPDQFRKCESEKGRITTHIKWDASAAGVKYVNVLVGNSGGDPKLFMTGKEMGERDTGNWVLDGTELILQNAANKQRLAVIKVRGQDC